MDQKSSLSRRQRAACLRNLHKAWKAPRGKAYELTPARREACRTHLRQAVEANHLCYKATPRRRAASLANLAKAREANRRNFRFTEARRAASEVTIRKAQAASRAPESYARSRHNHLTHGLTVRTLADTLHLLGEDPKELEAHRRLLARAFEPRDEIEERVIARIADTLWRRLRLRCGQARWEAANLRHHLRELPRETELSARETQARAQLLLYLLLEEPPLYRYEDQFQRNIERLLRYLVRKRAGTAREFHTYGRISRQELEEIEKGEGSPRRVRAGLSAG